MSTIPVIEVSHLASAASFYAAIVQPLGLQWLSSTNALHFGVPAFGAQPAEVIFTLFNSPQPKPSLLQFYAASPDAVNEFHKRALHAYPFSANLIQADGDGSLARITDFDGNILEARYVRRSQPLAYSAASSASTSKEARRVLDWQRDVARSMSNGTESAAPRSPSRPSKERHSDGDRHKNRDPPSPRLVRRETVTKEHYEPSTSHDSSPPPSQEAASTSGILGGMNQTLLGTILGVAAGAAVVYAMAKSTEEPPKEPVREHPRAPRRVVTYHGSSSRTGSTAERDSDGEGIAMLERSHTFSGGRRGDAPRYTTQHNVTKGVAALGLDCTEENRGPESRPSRHSVTQSARDREIEQLERDLEMLEEWDQPLSVFPPPLESVAKGESRESGSERERERERDRDRDRDRGRDSRQGGNKAGGRNSPSKSNRKSDEIKGDENRSTASRGGNGNKGEARSHTNTGSSEASTIKQATSGGKARLPKVPTPPTVHLSNRRSSMDSDRERRSATSGPSARYIALPESVACQSVVSSVTPQDSISCAGSRRRGA